MPGPDSHQSLHMMPRRIRESRSSSRRHMMVSEWKHNPEIYHRWIQAGIFQPIFRTHISTGGDPTPWNYSNFPLLRESFLFRNSLVPYLYTASYQGYVTGTLPIHPLYYEWPEEEMAYVVSVLTEYSGTNNADRLEHVNDINHQPIEYMFGNDFVVAPILQFSDPSTHLITWPVWVPPGGWVDWWDGSVHVGPAWYNRTYELSEIPLLVREGSVIPMRGYKQWYQRRVRGESRKNLVADPLVLVVVWSNSSSSGGGGGILYEDGGSDLQYKDGFFWILKAVVVHESSSSQLSVFPCSDGKGFKEAPETRSYTVKFLHVPLTKIRSVKIPDSSWSWYSDNRTNSLIITSPRLTFSQAFHVTVEFF
eukprot:TRINITY_DN13523_c0_g2_i2.p1 TRINITY_DN13523_c0_g2~~TRINITY_DN13523_c0_g2_i2.p1  ORF type:complete len:364 (+),score=73.16 TRINITY_DN13523_c0_g2_i2:204-1295(+)